ncbi:membrane protein (plasmid) [Rhodococcus erythropolis R138]|uniref:alpha/beta hydrolase n=1 Tax=Rhodococcus erythropolis TaxID=1833 RepID=UPI0007393D28|nr:alpha/beta-hydrolase family protein [Rhodococcus erythropolis]ALU73369.1 membrane protein [Rhodococcus erythropolis R138]
MSTATVTPELGPPQDPLGGRGPWLVARATSNLRRWLARFHPVGLAGALLFYCWSLSPSLLPRAWYLQGVATGISLATGYGLGVLIAWVVRKVGVSVRWSARQKRIGWYLLAATALIVVPLFLVLGSWWQDISRDLVGMEPGSSWDYPGVLAVAVVVAVIILVAGRGFRRVAQRLSRLTMRFLPAPVARASSVLVVGLVMVLLVEGLVSTEIARIAHGSAMATDEGTPDGIVAPQAPERSGSPVSLEPWDSLGREGRTFVAGGPDLQEISAVTGEAALTPIRVYAGYRSLDGTGAEPGEESMGILADHVVAELERTRAFEREYLAVATTTGRGWVNQDVAAALEYLAGGNSAIAAMQYSYLASPLAFLADRVSPRTAGRALFEAVYDRWSQLPAETRPKLLTFGESLGSYGGQSAFSGIQDMITRTDGALWVGTPNFTEQWRRITDSRDPGSREILPVVYGGRNVRFAATPADLADIDGLGEWDSPRIVYWQHPSDPIVWWSSDLILHRPDWLAEERGADIDQGMSWIPFVTFWQVTLDMVFAAEVPGGHGHSYTTEAVLFWADVLGIEDSGRIDRIFDKMNP